MKETKLVVWRIEKINGEKGENPWVYEIQQKEIIENKRVDKRIMGRGLR